jgi:Flp pilus assembly CpaF family ATPase
MPWRVNQHEQTAPNTTDQFVANFAIAESVVLSNNSIWVSKSKGGLREVKTPRPETRIALIFIPFEVHAPTVVH